MTSRLLLVDDDRQICATLGRYLVENGFAVGTVNDGPSMFDELAFRSYDLVLLDVSLPGEDGMALCRRLRADSKVPIVMLTARSGDIDRVVGLELGADDYVCKPFNPRELLARVRAVMRRSGDSVSDTERTASKIYEFVGWRLDRARRTLRNVVNGLVDLTSGEFDLLVAFVEHAQRVVTRENLLDISRGQQMNAFDRRIDVQVSRLRRKIETDPQDPKLIKTVRGGGYIFTAPVQRMAHESLA